MPASLVAVEKKPVTTATVTKEDDTDSEGLDCLVANETLQFSTNAQIKRKSPEIRKITKRASFA